MSIVIIGYIVDEVYFVRTKTDVLNIEFKNCYYKKKYLHYRKMESLTIYE